MIRSIPRRGGCDSCDATRIRIRYEDNRLHSERVTHQPDCPVLAGRRTQRTQERKP